MGKDGESSNSSAGFSQRRGHVLALLEQNASEAQTPLHTLFSLPLDLCKLTLNSTAALWCLRLEPGADFIVEKQVLEISIPCSAVWLFRGQITCWRSRRPDCRFGGVPEFLATHLHHIILFW